MSEEKLLQIENLCKYFRISRKETLKAVDGVSISISKGETVGLVGESGCGKSTLGRCIVRIYNPTSGSISYQGKDIFAGGPAERKEFCKHMQMIFQNPYSSLNPRMTVRDIVSEGMALHTTFEPSQAEERVIQLLETVGLNKDHLSRFPHEFSGGQRQRIGIARALSVEPEFIVCDEPISALDVSVQAQIINMMKNLQQKLGLTYLFIAHDLSVVKYISDRIIVMYLGSIVEEAPSEELYTHPAHPYTQALLSAIPKADPIKAKSEQRIKIEGEVSSPINPPDCCRFAERCDRAQPICHQEIPATKVLGPNHTASCHMI
jgi:oligopeptide transport system ATP-binding protein